MELMSSLLFFTLCTLATQVLGVQMDLRKLYHNHKPQKDQYYKQKQMSLNMKAPSFMHDSRNSTLDAGQDLHCRQCQSCMENAVKSHQSHHKYMVDRSLSDEDIRNKIQTDEIHNYLPRTKRSTGTGPELKITLTKDRKEKEKRNKKQKYYSVTKYVRDDEIYALKIKEYTEQFDQGNNSVLYKDASTCQVYQVNDFFSCKSLEGLKLLQAVENMKTFLRKKKHIRASKKVKTSAIQGVEMGQNGRSIIVL